MKFDKLHNLLGLAKRAGKIITGSSAVESSIKSGKSFGVIIALDAMESTRKRLKDKSSFYNVKVMEVGTKESLGHITGADDVAAISLLDQNFAKAIKGLYKEINGGGNNGET